MRNNKRYRYQSGGERNIPGPMANDPALLQGFVLDPREYVRLDKANAIPRGDIATHFGLDKRNAYLDRLDQIATVPKQEKVRSVNAQPAPDIAIKGDIATYVKRPNIPDRALQLQHAVAEQQNLQHQLERLGYTKPYAAIFARQGRDNLAEYMRKRIDDLEQDDYRVRHHPDFDPNKPVEQQQYLNYDNSLRTTLLRGRNLLVDSGNPVTNFITDVVTYPGKAFVNMTMDAEKQYIQPGPLQGTLNFGTDVLALFPSVANQASNRIVNRLVGKSLPEASFTMAQTLGKPRQIPAQELRTTMLREIQDQTDQPLLTYANAAQYPAGKVNIKKYGNILDQRFPEYATTPFNYKLTKLAPKELDHFVDDILKDIRETIVVQRPLPKGYDPKKLNAVSKEVDQALVDYYQLTKDPRYIERVRNLDKELGMNGELERRLKLFHQQGEQVQSGKATFNVSANDDIQAVASSTWPDDVMILNDFADKNGLSTLTTYLNERYYTPQERQLFWSPKYLMNPEYNVKSTMFHEGKHHWTNAVGDRKNRIFMYDGWLGGRVPRYDRSFGSLDDFLYYNSPTEIDAYLMTELRNDLVNTGYLKDHFDDLTETALKDYLGKKAGNQNLGLHLNRYFDPRSGLINDIPYFIKRFNKGLPIATGIGAGIGVVSGTQNKNK